VKKLTNFVQDVLKKHGKFLLNDAKKLWELACDGPGVTPSEFATLESILEDEDIEMTEAARLHLHYLVTRQESGTSLYKTVGGVRYDRACLDLAEHLFKDGTIDLSDAKQLWEEVEDGPGVTEVEKRTIEKIMADKSGHITAGALKFFNEKLAAWSKPGTTASTTAPASTSPVVAPAVSSPPSKPVATPVVPPPSLFDADTKTEEKKELHPGERIELIVDRSGSMRRLLDATVKGLNDFLTQQQAEPGAEKRQVRLTTFNNNIVQQGLYHCALPSVPKVTPEIVMPSGGTALLDAIGTVLSSLPVTQVSVVVIVTDGNENGSRRFNQKQVNALIAERMRAEWTFIFLAANQNAIETGAKYGLGAGSCATFTAAVEGIVSAFQAAHGLASRSWKSVEQEQRSFTTNERNAMQHK